MIVLQREEGGKEDEEGGREGRRGEGRKEGRRSEGRREGIQIHIIYQ